MFWYGWLRVRLGLAKPIDYDEIVDSQSEDGGSVGGDESAGGALNHDGEVAGLVPNESTCLLVDSGAGSPSTKRGGGGGSKMSKLIAQNSMAIVVLCVCLSVGMVDAGISTSRLGIDGLVSASGPPLCDAREPVSEANYALGCLMSWVSGLLYFFSRVSQIRENHARKSVEGVSIALFILSISGNFTYGAQIFLRGVIFDRNFYLATLPFLIGSFGTLIFDGALIYQAFIYGGFH
ncbi:hypothetical protein HDU98_001976 [Podochytrium sp. JEL0797]|nr:hypothetical protein HDU98_001976 [Podochytrium sp. JEL0797]